jgi:signal transduction histidine kinase
MGRFFCPVLNYDVRMQSKLNHTRLLRFAGLFTWAMVGLPLALIAFYYPLTGQALGEETVAPDKLSITLVYLAFGIAYWLVTRDFGIRKTRWYDIALLVIMTVSAIAISHFTGTGLGAILLMVVVGVIPWLMPVWVGAIWLVIQHLALIPVFIVSLGFNQFDAMLQVALYVSFASFPFIIGIVAKRQAQEREEQSQLNAELRATRALLAESSRMGERLRISRELHDLLGHHLTALSLNLEVAGHLTEGKAQEHVRQSHTLAKLLLTDVREAVSEMREEVGVDLGSALKSLIEGVSVLKVHLTVSEDAQIQDADRAHVMLRCTQEIITNTVRHSGADQLWLDLKTGNDAIELTARDNGRGARDMIHGNGLRGMRERLAQFGGQLTIINLSGNGLSLTAKLPLEKTT